MTSEIHKDNSTYLQTTTQFLTGDTARNTSSACKLPKMERRILKLCNNRYFSVSFHTSARDWRGYCGVRPSTQEVEFWRTTWVWVKPLRLSPSLSNQRRYSKNPKKTTTRRRKSQGGVQTGSGRVTNETFAVCFFTTVKVGLVEP